MAATFGSATLVLTSTDGRIQRALTREGATLGRSPSNDVVLDDPAVSQHHCAFSVEDGVLWVRDLDSVNGTSVNGRRVDGHMPVYDGDVLMIGQYRGRITVRSRSGQAFVRPGRSTPALVVGAVVALLAAGGLMWAMRERSRQSDDATTVARFEARVHDVLSADACAAEWAEVQALAAADKKWAEQAAQDRLGTAAPAPLATAAARRQRADAAARRVVAGVEQQTQAQQTLTATVATVRSEPLRQQLEQVLSTLRRRMQVQREFAESVSQPPERADGQVRSPVLAAFDRCRSALDAARSEVLMGLTGLIR